MRAAFLSILSLFSTVISAQALTAAQAMNLLGVNILLAEDLLFTVATGNNVNNSDPALPIYKGALDVHLSLLHAFFDSGVANEICNFPSIRLAPDLKDQTILSSLTYVELLTVMGGQAFLSTDNLNLTDSDKATIQSAMTAANTVATMVGPSVGLSLNDTTVFPGLTAFEYMGIMKHFGPNCTADIGLDTPDLTVLQDLPFGSPFSPQVNFTFSDLSNLCPNNDTCSCHSFAADPSVPDDVTAAGHCILAGAPGVNILVLTNDATPLSSDPAQRASSENTYVSIPVFFWGK